MPKSLIGLAGIPVTSADGDAGMITRVLVDVDRWVVGAVAVSASAWQSDGEILVAPSRVDPTREDADGLTLAMTSQELRAAAGSTPDPHVVDSADVIGVHLEAVGGAIGHLDDLLFDEKSWNIRYVVVDPNNWWLGKHVLIAPAWIERFDWSGRKAYVTVEREAIRSAPEYDAGLVLTRDDEAAIFRHYGREPYWS
jgi:hypothetical protein